MTVPAAPPGGGFARPPIAPPGPSPLVRPMPGGWSPAPPGRGPGGWAPPVVNHGWPRPGPDIGPRPGPTINGGNPFTNAPRTDFVTGRVGGRDVNVFGSGWRGASSAANAVSRRWGGGYSWDYGGGWGGSYWPQSWGGWGSGSESGYSNPYYVPVPVYADSGTGYGYGYGSSSPDYVPVPLYTPADTGSGNPYSVTVSVSTEARDASDSSTPAAPQERNDSAATSGPGKEDAAGARDEVPAAARQHIDAARLAFQKGDYAAAQSECELAIHQLPRDANLHEFRALCQFARGKYQDAAATLYPVLAAGPGWDWDTLSSFYTNAPTYTKQLRALEQSVKEHPKDAAGRFVLAYHYLVLGERDAALDQLQEVVRLQPKDRVSAGIREALDRAKKGKDQTPADKPAPGR